MSIAKPARRNTIRYAAEKLGYSVPTKRALIATGKLRVYGQGHATRVSDQAIGDCVALLEQEASAYRCSLVTGSAS